MLARLHAIGEHNVVMRSRILAPLLAAFAALAYPASAHIPAPSPAAFIVFFESDSADLNEQAKTVVANAAHLTLDRYPAVEIMGHADPSERNPAVLARRRADVVHQALIAAGIEEDRFLMISEEVGTTPIVNDSGQAASRGRLVVIYLCHKLVRCQG